MQVESIEVPAPRVPPIATDASSSAKVWAGVLGFIGCLFLIIALSDPTDPETGRQEDKATVVVGSLFIVAIFGSVTYRFVRNASRATRAAKTASSDPGYTWRLSGKYIIAADPHGAPRPELSFKVNRKLRTMLLAVPRAEVVDKT